MKRVAVVVAGLALLFTPGAATAKQVTISDHVASLVRDKQDKNERLVGEVEIAELGEAEIAEFVFQIDPAKSYYVRGACDDDCTDIDLEEFDAAGASVGEDSWPNAEPKVETLPGKSGTELHVIVRMESCLAETCVAGLGLFQGGQ